jgi:hypothetical protein
MAFLQSRRVAAQVFQPQGRGSLPLPCLDMLIPLRHSKNDFRGLLGFLPNVQGQKAVCAFLNLWIRS